MGSQVVGAGGDNVSGLSGDQGAVGVGDQAGEASGVDGGGNGCDWEAVGGEVVSLGGNNSGLVSGDDSAVGVGNEGLSVGVGTVPAVVAVVPGTVVSSPAVGTVVAPGTSVGVGTGVHTVVASPGGDDSALGGKVGGLSGGDLRGLGWGDGAVGVGHQLSGGNSGRGEESLQ